MQNARIPTPPRVREPRYVSSRGPELEPDNVFRKPEAFQDYLRRDNDCRTCYVIHVLSG